MKKPLSVKTFENAEDFLAAAGQVLYEHEAINGLMLGICERLVRNPTRLIKTRSSLWLKTSPEMFNWLPP